MKKLIICVFSLMMCMGIASSHAGEFSISPTTITISQPVNFLTNDGKDVIVKPGSYEVEAAGNTLRLQSPDMKDPIHVQAGPAPYPEDVDSPVAMAIPIPDEGIYLALAVPNDAGLEAMGSYSGIQTRGANFFQRRKTLTAQQRTQLKTFAGQLRKNANAPGLATQWKELTKEVYGQSSSIPTKDINALIQYVLRQSYLETNRDLQFYADKVRSFNQQKKLLREQIAVIRNKLAQAPSPKDEGNLEQIEEQLQQKLKELEEQIHEANLETQRLMSQYNQAEQAAAAILKKKQDSDSQAIRKFIN